MLFRFHRLGTRDSRRAYSSTTLLRGRRARRPVVEALEGRALMAITSLSVSLYNSSSAANRFTGNLATPNSTSDSTNPPKSFTQGPDKLGAQALSDSRSASAKYLDYLGETGDASLVGNATVNSTL